MISFSVDQRICIWKDMSSPSDDTNKSIRDGAKESTSDDTNKSISDDAKVSTSKDLNAPTSTCDDTNKKVYKLDTVKCSNIADIHAAVNIQTADLIVGVGIGIELFSL